MASAGRARLRTEKANGITLATLDLTQHDFDGFYNGFSNNCLWPLLHFRIDLMRFEREEFDIYRRVNARFAASLAKLLRPNDLVWVHDFHLIPLENPGLISIPLAFLLGILGTYLSKDASSPEKFAEMEVRSLTGAGSEKAVVH